MLDLAQEHLIDRAKRPRYAGHVDALTVQADGANQSCGDEVHFELQVVDGIITQVRHVVRGCTVCAAAADLLAEELEGEPVTHLAHMTSEHMQDLVGIPLSPTRLKCALLPLESLKGIDKTDGL